MTKIVGIKVEIGTSNLANAGIDSGDVYLGIGGREFHLDTSANNFRAGTTDTFYVGKYGIRPANVLEPEMNDPKSPQLELPEPITAVSHPYIRMEGGDHWSIRKVCVKAAVDGDMKGDKSIKFSIQLDPRGLWLGNKAGKICYVPIDKGTCTPDPQDWGQDIKD